MAEVAKETKVTDAASGDDDLPPPPPPLPGSQVLESIQQDLSQNFLPVPPPKETFTEFYQLQQKSELKRLLKHIHPALRKNLDDVVDDELIEAINPQAVETAYQGEVQSMRWIFENWTLDNIGGSHETKKLLDEENLQGGNVRGKSSLFEHSVFDGQHTTVDERPGLVNGDVRTATWLFETQSLDSINRSKMEDEEFVEVLLKEPIQKGDVRGARLLFESKPLDSLGRCCSVEDQYFLTLKSEIQEHKGDVKKTVKLFQADPCCALTDSSGNIHEIKSICREEIQSSNFKTARWLFETQPLDLINKGTTGVQIIRGISLEEAQKCDFDKKRWMFETQPLDAIQEGAVEEQKFQGTVEVFSGEAGVCNKLKLFENQPLSSLKGESTGESLEKDTIVGGNVGSTLWLFETQPMDTLKDSYEVGHLKKVVVSSNEKGEVRDKKQQFEKFRACKMTLDRKSKVEDVEKGDVNTFKNLFETIPLSHISPSENAQTQVSDITAGDVKGNCSLFETTPLYAIKDCAGHFHEVTTVSREECIKGNVQDYKWMFETKPLDQFEEGNEKVEIIKGITRQEDLTSDVRTAKWMFETQPLDSFQNRSEVDSTVPLEELQKGNVKTCKWLFETQPMDILYDKSERSQDVQVVPKANVTSHTWLFETQPLDNMKDKEEFSLKLCSTVQKDVQNDMNVQTVKHLFETETLDRITKRTDSVHNIRYVSQVDVQSGDVSRVKEIFESKSLDEIGSECIKELITEDQNKEIQTESVHKFTWLFENHPICDINEKEAGITHRVSDVEGGDVGTKKFIFETFSLDKIQDNDQLLEHQSMSVEKPMSGSVNVKSSTMLFESQPLYALRDKDGQFHEVTTVKKEEMVRGDVRGARWMFETKPLDTIQADKDIYVIRAVTQVDVLKGDVKSARWKFETQPLDSFTPREGPSVRVVEEIGHGQNVQQSKQNFETEQVAQKNYVRMVSVTDIQQGDVRTSTWLFENQQFDTLKGEPHEQNTLQTVHREDNTKGDVKRCTWLFESQALDKIKNNESTEEFVSSKEEIPKADVKSTTWLFETTPLDKIIAESVTDILYHLSHKSFIHSNGIIIQAYDYKYVNMAKYQFVNNEDPKVQKEEVVEGNIRNIMLQLLVRPNLKPKVVLLKEDEQGKVHSTVIEIPFQQPGSAENPDAECKIQEAAKIIESLLVQHKTIKTGLVIQESEGGQTEMTVYSLLCQRSMTTESCYFTRGDIKSTIGSLFATVHSHQTKPPCRLEENERGNVDLYRKCIEKGDICYLKSLQQELSEEEPTCSCREQIEIVQGDVNEAKRHLNQQREEVERTILDVIPGDVKSVKKVFSKVCTDLNVGNCIPKEEIVRGDVLSVKQQLDEALKQPFMVQKEEMVFGDIKATLESLERAKQQSLHVEREVIIPGTIYDLNVEAQELCSDENEGKLMKEEIISGDVKAAKRSLERAKNQRIERESVTPGKLYNLNGNLNESSQDQYTSTVQQSTTSSMSNQRITTTFRKVSETEKDQGSTEKVCHQNEEGRREDAIGVTDNGSTMLENNPQLSELEPDIVRGDVKAAIQSLQSAATEKRSLDREEIVRGNMQETLQSLEKSSINISKADYKAAMLYRKSGQSNTQRNLKNVSGTQECKSFVIPLPISDAELSSSVSVNGSEHLTLLALNSKPMISYNLEKSNQLSCAFANQGEHPPPIPPKSSHQIKDQKPVIPPKPQHITTNSGKAYICPSSPEPVINYQQTPAIPSKMTHSKKTFSHKNETWNFESLETSNKMKDKSCNSYEPVERTKDPMDLQKMQYTQQWVQNTHMEHMTPSVSKIENVDGSSFACDGAGMEKNLIQKINAAEEIKMCMQSYSKDKEEVNIGFKVALQNFGERKTASVGNTSSFPKKIKVVTNEINPKQAKGFRENTNEVDLHLHIKDNRGETPTTPEKPLLEYNQTCKELNNPEKKVVFREKKGRRETEDQRRQRLSIHKEEIMRGNVKEAMEIFENLMRREELKIILSKVQEMEGETCEVDVNSLKTLFENVPAWIANPIKNRKHRHDSRETRSSKEKEGLRDDVESVSSVEAAFEDLEKASMDIINLKEQTLAKLLEIEEAIKKALYSVSNLKSEADIAGLSGLFSESINDENVSPCTNKIRKIRIVSSKANTVQSKLVQSSDKKNEKPELPKEIHQLQMGKLPSSPSFISIHSAARNHAESPTPKPPQYSVEKSYTSHICSPQSPRRKVSILEVQTVPEVASGIIGTKTVNEKYEETDCFGNKYFSSKRSTFVTRQSETELSSSYGVVTNPGRYEVMTSPILQRSGHTYSSNSLCKSKDSKVFVTFGHPNTEKH